MPDNTANDGHAGAEGAGGTPSGWSAGWHKPSGRRILPPVALVSIQRLMPPLATRIWRQRDLLNRKRDRLAVAVTEPTGITSSLTGRISGLLTGLISRLRTPTRLSAGWPRLLDLTWFRRRRNQGNESLQRAKASKEVRPGNDTPQWADKPYPGESRPIAPVAEEEVSAAEVSAVDADYPLIIKNLLSSPASRVEADDPIADFLEPTYTTPTPFPAFPAARRPAASDSGGAMVSDISPIGIRSISRVSEIQRRNRRQVKDTEGRLARTDRQPRLTHPSRSLDQTWPPLIQSLVPYRILTPQPADITDRSTVWRQATPGQYQPPPIARLAEAEPGNQATTQPTYAAQIPEASVPYEETLDTEENDGLPLALEKESHLPYPLPDRSQPTGYGKMMNRAGQSARPETKIGSSEPILNSLPLNRQAASGLLSTRALRQRTPEIDQPVQPVFPQIRLLKTIGRRTGVTGISKDSPMAASGQDTTAMAIPTNVSLSQTLQTGEIEVSLVRRESLFTAGLRHQTPLLSDDIRRAPVLPYQPYPRATRAIDDTPVPDRVESRKSLTAAGLGRQSPLVSNIIHQAPILPYLPYQPYPRTVDDTPVADSSERGEPLSAAGLRPESPLVSDIIRRKAALHDQSYLKPLDDAPAPNRTRDRSWINNRAQQPASRTDNRQSRSEPPPAPVIEPKPPVDVAQSKGLLPAVFERETYYTSQPMPELALAPMEQLAPAASPTPPEAEAPVSEEAEGATTPDIDAIARDVYTILKRRLAREREQALGAS